MNTTQNPGYCPNNANSEQAAAQQPVYTGTPNVAAKDSDKPAENAVPQTPYAFAQNVQTQQPLYNGLPNVPNAGSQNVPPQQAQQPVYNGVPNTPVSNAQQPVYAGAPNTEKESDETSEA